MNSNNFALARVICLLLAFTMMFIAAAYGRTQVHWAIEWPAGVALLAVFLLSESICGFPLLGRLAGFAVKAQATQNKNAAEVPQSRTHLDARAP